VRQLQASELAAGPLRAELERVIERWLATRGMAAMSFLVQIEPFEFLAYRRWFVAERAGRALAFGGVVPVPRREGWFLEDLLRDPEAPNGTNELVIDAVMRWAASAGSRWLTLGLSPLSGNVSRPLAWLRRGTHPLYDFRGLRQYKAKFRPSSWCPIYLAYPTTQSALRSLLDVLSAFARGGLLGFGLRSLGRGPLSAVRLMTVLLVPWTLLLAAAPVERWFAKPVTRWAWVCFDLAVIVGLWRLLARPRPGLARFLAVLIGADSALTALEIGAWLTRHDPTWQDAVVFFLAWAAPTFAAVVLWGASRRLKTLAAEPS
jgi:phosphatidylglycerol lysyltransferase